MKLAPVPYCHMYDSHVCNLCISVPTGMIRHQRQPCQPIQSCKRNDPAVFLSSTGYRTGHWDEWWGRLRLRTTLKILKITYSTLDRGDRPEKRGPVGANRAVRSAGAHRAPEFRSRALSLCINNNTLDSPWKIWRFWYR
jgi:hypothetical protein